MIIFHDFINKLKVGGVNFILIFILKRQSTCYVCGEKSRRYCKACDKYFCGGCCEEYHVPRQRKKHLINQIIEDTNFVKRIDDECFQQFLRFVLSQIYT
jgi:hypothetical protein